MINTEARKKYAASVQSDGSLTGLLPDTFRPNQQWWYKTRQSKAAKLKGWRHWGDILQKTSEDRFAAELIYQLDHQDISSSYNIFYFMKHFMKWIRNPHMFLTRTDIKEAVEEKIIKQLVPGRGTRASSARHAALTARVFSITLGREWIKTPIMQNTARKRIEFMLTIIPLLAGSFLNRKKENEHYKPDERNSPEWLHALSEERKAGKDMRECACAIEEARKVFFVPLESFKEMVEFAISIREADSDPKGAAILKRMFLSPNLPPKQKQA